MPRDWKKKLPVAKLMGFEWSRHVSYWARFRLANAWRFQLGRLTITVRAPWLEGSARAIHPHLFEEAPRDGE